MDPSRHIIPLDSRYYNFIYRELNYKSTFHYVDEMEMLNFIIKVDTPKNLEKIYRSKKLVYVTKDLNGPVIEIVLDSLEVSYKFLFDINIESHLYNAKKLIDNKKVIIHFLFTSVDEMYKALSIPMEIDEGSFNKFIYILNYCYEGQYPRINFEGYESEEGYCLSFNDDNYILEELLEVIDKLEKWKCKDVFSVYIEKGDNLNLVFDGKITNIDFIKNELIKKYKIVDEGNRKVSGKPFFLYDKGLLYFYESSLKFE